MGGAAAEKVEAAAEKVEAGRMEVMCGVGSWLICSAGMLVFNKKAIGAFPLQCTLVALQMLVTVVIMLVCCWGTIHIGSLRDVLRWSRVVPTYTGMLLTSILALKHAPLSLVIVFRSLAPLFSNAIERLYPNPLKVTPAVLGSFGLMFVGAGLYCTGLHREHLRAIGWVVLNNFFSVADSLLHRLMLAQDQKPVDISKTGATLLKNLLGMVPLVAGAAITGEVGKVGGAIAGLDTVGYMWVTASCVVGVGISYTGIWAQSLITATSFLVLVNLSKFIIILLEAYIMHTKFLQPLQFLGAIVAILAGVLYGKAREQIKNSEKEKAERKPLIGGKAV